MNIASLTQTLPIMLIGMVGIFLVIVAIIGGPFSACCAGQKTFPPGIPLLDKIERRTAHSAQRASHTLCA